MSYTQRVAAGLMQRMGFLPALPRDLPAPIPDALPERPGMARPPASIRLFRVVTIRGDLVLGLSPAELAALGPGPDLDRLARRFSAQGQVSGWLYHQIRGPDGVERLQPTGRVAIRGEDALTLRPHAPGLPVQPPPLSAAPSPARAR